MVGTVVLNEIRFGFCFPASPQSFFPTYNRHINSRSDCNNLKQIAYTLLLSFELTYRRLKYTKNKHKYGFHILYYVVVLHSDPTKIFLTQKNKISRVFTVITDPRNIVMMSCGSFKFNPKTII